jgi:hypothetical protein
MGPAVIHSGAWYFTTNLPESVTIDPDELTEGIPFVYSLRGEWFVAVRQHNGRLLIYYMPPHQSWYSRLWRWLTS